MSDHTQGIVNRSGLRSSEYCDDSSNSSASSSSSSSLSSSLSASVWSNPDRRRNVASRSKDPQVKGPRRLGTSFRPSLKPSSFRKRENEGAIKEESRPLRDHIDDCLATVAQHATAVTRNAPIFFSSGTVRRVIVAFLLSFLLGTFINEMKSDLPGAAPFDSYQELSTEERVAQSELIYEEKDPSTSMFTKKDETPSIKPPVEEGVQQADAVATSMETNSRAEPQVSSEVKLSAEPIEGAVNLAMAMTTPSTETDQQGKSQTPAVAEGSVEPNEGAVTQAEVMDTPTGANTEAEASSVMEKEPVPPTVETSGGEAKQAPTESIQQGQSSTTAQNELVPLSTEPRAVTDVTPAIESIQQEETLVATEKEVEPAPPAAEQAQAIATPAETSPQVEPQATAAEPIAEANKQEELTAMTTQEGETPTATGSTEKELVSPPTEPAEGVTDQAQAIVVPAETMAATTPTGGEKEVVTPPTEPAPPVAEQAQASLPPVETSPEVEPQAIAAEPIAEATKQEELTAMTTQEGEALTATGSTEEKIVPPPTEPAQAVPEQAIVAPVENRLQVEPADVMATSAAETYPQGDPRVGSIRGASYAN